MFLKRRSFAVLAGGALGGVGRCWAAPAAGALELTAAQAKLGRQATPLPVPQRALLLSVCRAGPRLIAVGEQGTVVLSDDDGATWRGAQQVETSATLTQVRFADPRHGWAVGHLGVVMRTHDGGEHWRRVLDGDLSAQVALAEARASAEASQRVRSAVQMAQDGPDKPLLDLLVRSGDSVTVVGAFNMAYRSDDAGLTWREVGPLDANPRMLHLYGLAADGADELFVGEAGLLMRRPLGSRAARALATPSNGTFSGILVLDTGHWLLYGLKGRILRTKDAGLSWASAQVPGEATVNCALRLAGHRIVVGDQTGRVLLSDDAGATFQVVLRGGPPVTGLAATSDGGLAFTTLIGVARLTAHQLKNH